MTPAEARLLYDNPQIPCAQEKGTQIPSTAVLCLEVFHLISQQRGRATENRTSPGLEKPRIRHDTKSVLRVIRKLLEDTSGKLSSSVPQPLNISYAQESNTQTASIAVLCVGSTSKHITPPLARRNREPGVTGAGGAP